MPANAVVRARVDADVKAEAARVLDDLGLSLSDLIRMTVTRVARDRAVPFDLRRPNARTAAAMAQTDALLKRGDARFDDVEGLVDGLEGRRGSKAGDDPA
ncbi:MAG TPA: type II toxin-antitoxin system RelB/DinJ family antitoxin [Beijerinckiaceae bacterium]|jgi:DNA-damage-inducible protein J